MKQIWVKMQDQPQLDVQATKMKIEPLGPKERPRASNKRQIEEPQIAGTASKPPTAAPANDKAPDEKDGFKSLPTQNFDFDQHINKVSSLGKISSNQTNSERGREINNNFPISHGRPSLPIDAQCVVVANHPQPLERSDQRTSVITANSLLSGIGGLSLLQKKAKLKNMPSGFHYYGLRKHSMKNHQHYLRMKRDRELRRGKTNEDIDLELIKDTAAKFQDRKKSQMITGGRRRPAVESMPESIQSINSVENADYSGSNMPK